MTVEVDVLCAGLACYDLIFSVDRHPGPDEKVFAGQFFDCGGGPAANAAVAAARLGAKSAFAAGLAAGMPWQSILRFAGAAAALCCCRFGARLGMPAAADVRNFLTREPKTRPLGV